MNGTKTTSGSPIIDLSHSDERPTQAEKKRDPLVTIALILIIIAACVYISEILIQGFRCIRLAGIWC
jgi:hypothetical protein